MKQYGSFKGDIKRKGDNRIGVLLKEWFLIRKVNNLECIELRTGLLSMCVTGNRLICRYEITSSQIFFINLYNTVFSKYYYKC